MTSARRKEKNPMARTITKEEGINKNKKNKEG